MMSIEEMRSSCLIGDEAFDEWLEDFKVQHGVAVLSVIAQELDDQDVEYITAETLRSTAYELIVLRTAEKLGLDEGN